MKEIIAALQILKESELNGSELLVLCTLCESGYLRINDMVDKFGWEKRWAESNVAKLHQKGFLSQSGQGFRYKLSKNGVHYTTEIFHQLNKPGTPYEVSI